MFVMEHKHIEYIVCPLGGIIFCHLETKVLTKEYYASQQED